MAAQTKKKINFICYCVFIFSFPFHLDVVIFNEIIMVNFLLLLLSLSLSLATMSHAVAAGRIYYSEQNARTNTKHKLITGIAWLEPK